MATILETLREQLDASASTIAKAIDLLTESEDAHATIAAAVAETSISPASGVEAYVVSFDVNGGTGTVAPMACASGSTITLPDGTGITPPTDKKLVGWGTAADTAVDDAVTEYAATAAATLYAVWDDAE